MGVDTMEVPVPTEVEPQKTDIPLKPTERTAQPSAEKQILKAGWRTGNPEGARDMIDALKKQSPNLPPRLELPPHERAADTTKDASDNVGNDESATAQGSMESVKREKPSLFSQVAKNAGPVARDRFGKIKQHVADKVAERRAPGSAGEAVASMNSEPEQPEVAKADENTPIDAPVVAPDTSSNGSVSNNSSDKFWEGFDEQFASKKEPAAPVSTMGHNGTVETEEVAVTPKVGKAPDGYLKEQVAAFEDSLKPVEKSDEDELQERKNKEVEDTWKAAKNANEEHKATQEKAAEDAELAYRSKLFSSKATLDQFAEQSAAGRAKKLDERDEVLDAVWKPDVKLTEKQQKEIQQGQKPLDTSEGQKQFYDRVQGPAPDRPAPGTTTSYAARAENSPTAPTKSHIGPEAAAMRAAEDKTSLVYGEWKKIANAEKIADELRAKNARLQNYRRTALAGLIGVGAVMGFHEDVLAPGVGAQPATSAAEAVSPGIVIPAPETSVSDASSHVAMPEAPPNAPMPEPPPPDLIVPAPVKTDTEAPSQVTEKEEEGKAYIAHIDKDGDSISQSAMDQKIPGVDTVEKFDAVVYSDPVHMAMLLDGNADVFVDKHHVVTREALQSIVEKLAYGSEDERKQALEDAKKIADHVEVGDEILVFDKAGFDEKEQWYISKVKEEGAKGNMGTATVWAKLHADLVRQKEAAMKSPDDINFSIMTDDEVDEMRAGKAASQKEATQAPVIAAADQAIPNVTDPVNPASVAPKAKDGFFSRIGNLFRRGNKT